MTLARAAFLGVTLRMVGFEFLEMEDGWLVDVFEELGGEEQWLKLGDGEWWMF